MVIEPKRQELRRHLRLRVCWPAIVEVGNRLFHVETLDVSPFGAKVRLDERLQEGSVATLHLRPPQGPPLDIQAIVWRTDEDGPAFFFIEAATIIQPTQ